MGEITERLARARRALRRGGVGELAASARAKLGRGGSAATRATAAAAATPSSDGVPMSAPYQVKLAGALEERWELVRSAIPEGAATVLDVGCNLGDIAARCARHGLWSVGIDSSQELIEQARERHQRVGQLAFMRMKLGPADVSRLPAFDVVLLLSVHHHWLGALGPDVAGAMLRDLVARTSGVVVFESSSRRVRFGDHAPDFVDNDEASVTRYHERYLDQHVGDLARIVPLGKTPCVGEREPYRWSWALER